MADAQLTKRAIAAALKQICREKPFHKISVADLTAQCGLNRQTFYYHFQDKFELLNWVYYEDAFAAAIEGITADNWTPRLQVLLHAMYREKWFYTATIKDQPEHFSNYLFQIGLVLFRSAIDRLDETNRISQRQKQFYASFYAHGMTGSILAWAKGGMQETPEELVALSVDMVTDSARLTLLHLETEAD